MSLCQRFAQPLTHGHVQLHLLAYFSGRLYAAAAGPREVIMHGHVHEALPLLPVPETKCHQGKVAKRAVVKIKNTK